MKYFQALAINNHEDRLGIKSLLARICTSDAAGSACYSDLYTKLQLRLRGRPVFRLKKPENTKASHHEVPAPNALRRVLGLLPDANDGILHEIKGTDSLRFHHLLVSLEGSEKTGCLKIVSTKRKSRSAILLYKGRVVGCVYGQRSLGFQYLAEDAHKFALSDLASPGNIVDAYELPEDLVLATASLFGGQTLNTNFGLSSEQTCKQALSGIMQSGLPGCVVINDLAEEIKAIAYVAEGKIVGVHTATSGWVAPKIESLHNMLQSNDVQIAASVMSAQTNPKYGFSLTGLADRNRVLAQHQLQAIDAITSALPSFAPQQPAAQPANRQGTSSSPARNHRAHPAQRAHESSTFAISPR